MESIITASEYAIAELLPLRGFKHLCSHRYRCSNESEAFMRSLSVLMCIVCGVFMASRQSVAQCGPTQPCLAEIDLNAGWNLICLPLEPVVPALAEVFAPLIEAGNLIQVRGYVSEGEGRWATWASSPFPLELNDLTELHAQFGYWVEVKVPTKVLIEGCPPTDSISVQAGWNLVGPRGLETRLWDAVFAGLTNYMSQLWAFQSPTNTYIGLDFGVNPPAGDLVWLGAGQGFWVNAVQAFDVQPPVAERIFPAFIGLGGAGIADFPIYEKRYNEFTFESAGFDIDRPELGCYGPEDTDAWDEFGDYSYDIGGNLGPDGEPLDPPVAGRYKMLVHIGSPVAAPDPSQSGYVSPNNWTVFAGGLAIFRAANRPDIPLPDFEARGRMVSRAAVRAVQAKSTE